MREALDMMDYVWAAYAVGAGSLLALVGWSWLEMRRAEARREQARRR